VKSNLSESAQHRHADPPKLGSNDLILVPNQLLSITTTWQSSQIHNEKIGILGALSAPKIPIFS
jgi:hypothetical protein